MQIELSKIVREALSISSKEFTKTVEQTTELLCNENGNVGLFQITGRLVRIKPIGKALVIGDLHGDLDSLIEILQQSRVLQRMPENPCDFMIFLGDYGDRGNFSAEVFYIVLKLKLRFPDQIVLMRGNHEGPDDLPVSPHDLPLQFRARFGEEWADAYARTRDLFNYLYNCVHVEDRYMMVHGGVPEKARRLEDLANAHLSHPQQTFLEEMLWNDPHDEVEETIPSPRGAGKLFGRKITDDLLRRFKVKVLARAHEPCREGFDIRHNGKVLTLFSRRGPPYFNEQGAYLFVELSEEFEDAYSMIPYIVRF